MKRVGVEVVQERRRLLRVKRENYGKLTLDGKAGAGKDATSQAQEGNEEVREIYSNPCCVPDTMAYSSRLRF